MSLPHWWFQHVFCDDRSGVDESVPFPEAVEQYTECIRLNPNDARVG